ncbi:hypothetical protein EVAR_34558_1 [Eumeta japonica]|uniref:Uncharacterized protein n=1 Tax=Eumeta variegata TaxID=151549 RepID=A0A4C1X494_EUMVA|nr:hypothetical protein EVAR_34558_1 [Eumeta japonica]
MQVSAPVSIKDGLGSSPPWTLVISDESPTRCRPLVGRNRISHGERSGTPEILFSGTNAKEEATISTSEDEFSSGDTARKALNLFNSPANIEKIEAIMLSLKPDCAFGWDNISTNFLIEHKNILNRRVEPPQYSRPEILQQTTYPHKVEGEPLAIIVVPSSMYPRRRRHPPAARNNEDTRSLAGALRAEEGAGAGGARRRGGERWDLITVVDNSRRRNGAILMQCNRYYSTPVEMETDHLRGSVFYGVVAPPRPRVLTCAKLHYSGMQTARRGRA